MKRVVLFGVFVLLANMAKSAFDPQAYFDYMKSHKDMTYQQLLTEFPSGDFIKENHIDFKHFKYADSVIQKFGLNVYELKLLNTLGFMVTERKQYNNFLAAFDDIYQKDLPVYISADAILHSVHNSLNRMLESIETNYLDHQLLKQLDSLKKVIPLLKTESQDSLYIRSLKDFDVYLTVPLNIDQTVVKYFQPYFAENITTCNKLLQNINSLQPASVNIFSETCREYDFSQFQPRGYYIYALSTYFKRMMWLGRTEIYIDKPIIHSECTPTNDDIDRQLILIAIIADAVKIANILPDYFDFQNILTYLCGTQNGCNVKDVLDVMDKLGIKNSSELVDAQKRRTFQNELKALNSSKQLYQSQILSSNPDDTTQVSAAPVFLYMGQRPVIDGFIAANVVYDRIKFKGTYQMKMLPNSLDVLFSLGNDASIQLLSDELNKYNYSSNLAACRYLVSSLDSTYWNSSYYNGWLNSIRCLNPPKDRSDLPLFMQTGAWQQKNMTTQLASWAELRHDFILYVMQSYTREYACSNPDFFVEPVPELYAQLFNLGAIGPTIFHNYSGSTDFKDYFDALTSTSKMLYNISIKTLNHEPLEISEINFGKSVFSADNLADCVPRNYLSGWYPKLFFSLKRLDYDLNDLNSAVIADIHTSPTDDMGNPVGWVKHIGTGKVNLAVIGTKNSKGEPMAFAGPVYSFYEVVTTNYKRLTDEEWLSTFSQSNALRPSFTNLYTIDTSGVNSGEKIALPGDKVGVNDPQAEVKPELICYPNPFKTSCLIGIKVPQSFSGMNFDVQVTDINGNKVSGLLSEPIESGNYLLRWEPDGKLSSGMYFVRLSAGNSIITTKIEYVK